MIEQSNAAAPDVPYDLPRLRIIMQYLEARKKLWERFFSHFNIEPLRFEYDQVVQDYPRYLEPLLRQIQLEPIHPTPQRRVLRTWSQPYVNLVERCVMTSRRTRRPI